MHITETPRMRANLAIVPVLFTLTIFLSASLLFFVQPLFAKIALPQIGGAPAVWTTAMLFFQTVLIAGYVYAHLLSRYVPQRAQIAVHLGFWALALIFLPLGLPTGWAYDINVAPAWQTLTLFAAGVGLPFAVLSANAPLIQSWYAKTDGPSADDPYFLYGASNLGSLMALLAFPLAAEPLFGAGQIGIGWAIGFVALGGFLLMSGLSAKSSSAEVRSTDAPRAAVPKIKASQVAYWLLLAFIPSSLMLAITSKISTDIGAIPLVWVVPLSLYLLTFVLTFTRKPLLGTSTLRLGMLIGLLVMGGVFTGLSGAHLSWAWVAGLVLAFFAVSLYAHRALYEARPDGSQLTIFYVIMSIGGALGGLFNSIVAPVVFDGLYEGGITALLAVMLAIRGWNVLDRKTVLSAFVAGLLGATPVVLASYLLPVDQKVWMALVMILLIAIVVIAFRRSLPAAAIAASTLTLIGGASLPDDALHRDRGFFGTHRVLNQDDMRLYSNGTTVHGAQRLSDFDGGRPEPLYYYHKNAPMAQIMTSEVGTSAKSVGIVGQGVGSLACYALPGQSWAFYEIDPIVDGIARNPEYFTFMSECAGDAPTHLGDARIVLSEQSNVRYDVLVIDAYSSDAVPVHLTTNEAMELYMSRLTPTGVLVYHISNRYYEIDRPLGRSAEALGLSARLQEYRGNRAVDAADTPSAVAMIARDEAHFGSLLQDERWIPLTSDGGRIWTDDHANLLSILKRKKKPE